MALSAGTPPEPLILLLSRLDALGYHFVTVTPSTHALVAARKAKADDLRDVLGWSLPFEEQAVPADILALLDEAGALDRIAAPSGEAWLLRSRIRVSSFGRHLLVHSAFPTDDPQSVFFGPDSYRFADFIACELRSGPAPSEILDLGCGTGIGGIAAAAFAPGASIGFVDRNPLALQYCRVNARACGIEARFLLGDGSAVEGPARPDLIVANPPYMLDPEGPVYRNGGAMRGAELSLAWARSAAARLRPGGRLLLYSGAAIADGRDLLKEALESEAEGLGCTLRYREIDVDVFGEELGRPAYSSVERIAAVGAVLTRHP